MIPLLLALSCIPVDGPKLLARHFAAAAPAFQALAPETGMGYAPIPGAVRTIRPDELSRIGSRHGLSVSVSEPVCFSWEMAPLDAGRVEQAMRESLPPEATLELVEVSRSAVPSGDVEFPASMLKSGLWRGYVKYGSVLRVDVWARVRLSVKQIRVIAASPLKLGERITAGQLRIEQVDAPPEDGYIDRIEDAIGLVPKRSLTEGTALLARMLDKPAAVHRGDTVRLRAISGAAQITVDVQAQAAGKPGDLIAVKNPSSGRVLHARVEQSGEVTLAQ
jgi:flagella basal body P-ring formation protein FlgA